MILWLFVQLVFWLAVMGAIVACALVAIGAPPYLAGRYLWHRFR